MYCIENNDRIVSKISAASENAYDFPDFQMPHVSAEADIDDVVVAQVEAILQRQGDSHSSPLILLLNDTTR